MYSRAFSGFGTARNVSSTARSAALDFAVKPRIGAGGCVAAAAPTTTMPVTVRNARNIQLLYSAPAAHRAYRCARHARTRAEGAESPFMIRAEPHADRSTARVGPAAMPRRQRPRR